MNPTNSLVYSPEHHAEVYNLRLNVNFMMKGQEKQLFFPEMFLGIYFWLCTHVSTCTFKTKMLGSHYHPSSYHTWAGLRITVLPAARRGDIFHANIISG